MDTVRGAAGVGEPFREIVDAEVIDDDSYQPRHACSNCPHLAFGVLVPDPDPHGPPTPGYEGRHRQD